MTTQCSTHIVTVIQHNDQSDCHNQGQNIYMYTFCMWQNLTMPYVEQDSDL